MMTDTQGIEVAEFRATRVKIALLLREAIEQAERLPAVPMVTDEDGETFPCCECGSLDELRLDEWGYSRFTRLEYQDGTWIGITDGWDDMSEDSDGPTIITCFACMNVYRAPDDIDWN